ncbi:unnamed protein product [Effrenium voratum]|nr:unnamed protein product [Effrenium voratum]
MELFPAPENPLRRAGPSGRGNSFLLVAPHAVAELEGVGPFIQGWPGNRLEVAEEMDEWHDHGSGEAFEAACAQLATPGFRPVLPRGLLDLNRGWRGRSEAAESLFGKGALSSWALQRLKPGAPEALETWYRACLEQIREASAECRGFVEIHSYGDLGSTYDMQNGGRPLRRSEAAVVLSTPWATQRPVGLARLLPGDLRGTPKELQRLLDLSLERHGFQLGPSPYPLQGPWALSTRFLAARWFHWLKEQGHLPAETAEHLALLAWKDEQDAEMEAVAMGTVPEHGNFRGVRDLALKMGEWSHAAGQLGEVFARSGCFTLVVEMRCDLVKHAEKLGAAVAEALRQYVDGTCEQA